MDRTDLEILRNFEQVWQRVQKDKAGQTETNHQELEALMDGLADCWQSSRKLAYHTCGTQKIRLMRLSERIKKQYDCLQLHYFLKKGDIHFCKPMSDFASYTPYNLRKLWLSTVKNEELLKNCILHENDEVIAGLEEMKTEFSDQKMEIEQLIGELLQ